MARRRETEVEFSQPVRQIALMLASLAAVAVIGWFLYEPIRTVFTVNPWLNGLILTVFAIGVVACFREVAQLVSAVSWIEGFAVDRPGHEFAAPPSMLRPLAALLRDSRSRRAVSASSARAILDSIGSRLDERRDVTRYLGSLLIFLGLLGTFWGLSVTVPAVVETIRSLAPDRGAEAGEVFDDLMSGLESQLGGMGTAFASSLLGLAGSLVIGLLELFVGHGQNRFYRDLELWLSSITRLGVTPELEGAEGGAAAALLAQNAAQVEALAALVDRADDRREAFDARLAQLTETVSRLAGALSGDGRGADPAAARLAERQVALLEKIAERLDRAEAADAPLESDAEVRGRIRSIDRQLLRLVEEIATGRQDAVAELRDELNTLGRAVLQLADRGDGRAADRRGA
jgi:hypothetical protein